MELSVKFKFDKNKIDEESFKFNNLSIFKENLNGSLTIKPIQNNVLNKINMIEYYENKTNCYNIPKNNIIEYKIKN